MTNIPDYDAKALKARGIMEQKQTGFFTVRLRIVGGRVRPTDLANLSRIVKDFDCGEVHITCRQSLEIPNVKLCDVEALYTELARAQLGPPAVGPCVRAITACQGDICKHGLLMTQELAQKIDDRFFGTAGLPHKFKIAITGCPNGCMKPRENDFGIMGVTLKDLCVDSCNACGLCVRKCPVEGALSINSGRLEHNPALCLACGKCVEACPAKAWTSEGNAYAVFLGGKMGKLPQLAQRLPYDLMDEDSLLDTIEAAIQWYKENGQQKERFGSTIARVGFENLVEYLGKSVGL